MSVLSQAMREIRDEVIEQEPAILDAVMHKPLDSIVGLIPIQPYIDAAPKIRDELFSELIAAGQRQRFPRIEKATLSYRFDAERPEAAAWAEKEAGNLIVEVVQEQVNTVRDYVSRASMGEFSPRQVARGLRDTIGLTSQQAGWVDNFRERRISDLMSQGRLFDQAYEQSERATRAYHDRIHRYRTETIARTEILRASHEGRRESWSQGIEEGFISVTDQKVWSTNMDGRECDICGPLDGSRVLITDDFPEGEPPIHPNCRCDVLLVDDPDADIAALSDEDLDALLDELMDGSRQTSPGDEVMPQELDSELEQPAVVPQETVLPEVELPSAIGPGEASGISPFMTLSPGPERAATFFAESYDGNMAVKQVLQNRAAGLPDLQGVNLDGGAFEFMQRAQRYTDGSQAYTQQNLSADILTSADQIQIDLANAQPTERSLYRGMRVDGAESLFNVGDEIDLTYSSSTPREQVASLYTREAVERQGEDAVLMEFRPGVRAADIDKGRMQFGQQNSEEHLLSGAGRIVEVRRDGNIIRVVVESAE